MTDTKEARRQAIKEALEEVFLKFGKAVSRSIDPCTLAKTIRAKREVFLPNAGLSVRLFEVVEWTFIGSELTLGGGYCAPASQRADIELSYHEERVDTSSLDESVDSRKCEYVAICVPGTENNTYPYPDRATTRNAHLKISFIKRKTRSPRQK